MKFCFAVAILPHQRTRAIDLLYLKIVHYKVVAFQESRLMTKWFIQYPIGITGKNLIEKWLDKLTAEQLKSVAKEIKMLEIAGNELKLPHSKALNNGLFELRERRFGYRIYYCFRENNIILLLIAGDKQSQEKNIKTARERLATL